MSNRRLKITLEDLNAVTENAQPKNEIEFNVDSLCVIKRDGRCVPYEPNKMKKVCLWACEGNEEYANDLLTSTKIKLYDRINIVDVYNELIKTAANKISRIHYRYEMIAAKLLLLKIYRDTANIKTNLNYPHMKDVIAKGIKHKKYKEELFNSFSDQEIEEINSFINPEFDYLFTYKSLTIFNKKYCLNYSKNKKFELPQHTYMRIAMSLFYHEDKAIRIGLIKKFYLYLAQHYFTVSTPITLNVGTPKMQLSSCVLSKMGDSVEGIMDTTREIAIYSKNKGGNAVDISSIRSSGSYILGNNGISSGPVPFIKIIEATIKAFNQGSERPGVCCVYFQWWHYNFEELIVLKNNSGTEENRARQLKYSVKINDLLIKRALKKQDITLFNPSDVPKLNGLYGEEFERQYLEYESREYLKTKKIPATKILEMIFKERVETGNIYMFHEENVNNVSMLNRYINSSNLCCEITLPSRESKQLEERMDPKTNKMERVYEMGEISLCNLSSINLVKYLECDINQKIDVINILVRALDNTIDIADYPVPEAKKTNLKYRYLGIGVLNYANYLAKQKIIIDSDEALEKTHELFDELSYLIISSSLELAKLKGKFENFDETLWAQGQMPIFKANQRALSLTKYKPDLNKWKELSEQIKIHGLRNAQLMAIAPTATTGKAINATESIEPIQDFIYKEDGKTNVTTLVPNLKENAAYYKKAIDCDQYMLIKLAAIRQCYIDQAQSVNIYFKKVSSITDFSLYHLYGFELGMKTFYYCKTLKEVAEDVCESCT